MHVAAALLDRGESVVGIDNFTPYYSVNLKHARVAHLEARYGEPFTFIDVDFGDANALAEVLANHGIDRIDRKSVVEGKSVSVRVDLGGRRIIKKKKKNRE